MLDIGENVLKGLNVEGGRKGGEGSKVGRRRGGVLLRESAWRRGARPTRT